MYKIEKGKPIPQKRIGREPKYPFGDMKPGDSFVAPKVARAAAYIYASRTNTVFMTRSIDDENLRIWRIA